MFTIKKKGMKFSNAHQLHGLPEGHQCSRLHGHNYIVDISFQARSLDKNGFVFDLTYIADEAKKTFDHRNWNDILPEGVNSTAENIALFLSHWATLVLASHGVVKEDVRVSCVEIWETDGTYVKYEPPVEA